MSEEEKKENTEAVEVPKEGDAPKEDQKPADTAPTGDSAQKEDQKPADDGQADASDEGEEVEVPEKFKSIVGEIEQMSVLDLHELVKVFEKKFGVSAAAVAAAPDSGGGEEEDTGGGLVTVKLEEAGDNKIQVIKVVKEALGLGLKEAKDVVDGAPKDLKEGITGEEAEETERKT